MLSCRRKEIWKQEVTNGQNDRKQPLAVDSAKKTPPSKIPFTPASAASSASRSVGRGGRHTIQELLATDMLSNRFTVKARVTSFHPLQLNEVVVRHCLNCGEEYVIPDSSHSDSLMTLLSNSSLQPMRLACFYCDDSEHDFVCFKYRFCLWLEDEEGTSLQVPLTNPDVCLSVSILLVPFAYSVRE